MPRRQMLMVIRNEMQKKACHSWEDSDMPPLHIAGAHEKHPRFGWMVNDVRQVVRNRVRNDATWHDRNRWQVWNLCVTSKERRGMMREILGGVGVLCKAFIFNVINILYPCYRCHQYTSDSRIVIRWIDDKYMIEIPWVWVDPIKNTPAPVPVAI